MNTNHRKELYLQITPFAIAVLSVFWLLTGLYFLTAYQEYQNIAPQLAQLESPRGATQMLLVPVNQLVLWFMIAWSCAFGARSIAQEYEWHTAQLIAVQTYYIREYLSKIGLQALTLLFITTPFWFAVAYLSPATHWDKGLLVGIFATQLLIAIYATLLASTLSATFKQSLSSALIAVIIWLSLWLAPLLITEPENLFAILQWFSPLAHANLLTQGQFTLQTAIFLLMHILFFGTWLYINLSENN